MQKYRIYELAKIYNKGNDEIIAVLNKNNIEVKNRLNSVDEKAKKRFSTKLLHLLLSKRIKGRLCVPYDLISKDVRPEARRRKYKKNLILHITQLYQNL